MVIQLLLYVVQAVVLILFRNYYVYIVFLPFFTVLTNFVISIYAKKIYPQYICIGKVSSGVAKTIKKNVLALVGGQLSNTVLHSSDNVVLSAFIGLSMVAIYENYFYILNAVIAFTGVIYTSLTAGLGNSIVTETKEKNYNDFRLLSFMNVWLVMWCSVCILCLIQPFMKLWVGSTLMFSTSMAVLFTLYFYAYQINKIVLTYKDAAGLWWQDRYRPYVVMLTNIILNVGTVKMLGVYGVILSSIVSLCISSPWSSYTIFKHLFKMNLLNYFKEFFGYLVVTGVCWVSTYYVCGKVYLVGFVD
jgi:O-antigen/teichoic acid export membrane protein